MDRRARACDVYIGIPFCTTRCAYCSFSSGEIGDGRLVEPYMAALLHEIEACAEMAREMGLHIRVGYIGGGTPSSLTTPQLDRLLTHVEKHFGALAEFTVEAGRPDTLDAQKLRMLRDHPVTRISINPQTMNDATLTRIGRAHTAKQTVETYELARSIGFDDINMDVIAALPGEDYAMFAHTLAEIRRLRPESLTVHTLAIKRSSRLHEEKYAQAEQDVARMVALGRQTAHDMACARTTCTGKNTWRKIWKTWVTHCRGVSADTTSTTWKKPPAFWRSARAEFQNVSCAKRKKSFAHRI